MGAIHTRTFKSGNSIAVRLPRELGFAADMPVRLERVGNCVTIRPALDPVEEKRKLTEMIDALHALGAVGEIEVRDGDIFTDRPGLHS